MYTKKILSAAAAVAVMSTGAMAFDTNATGLIIPVDPATGNRVGTEQSSYVGGHAATSALELSSVQKGDALIFPAYKAEGGWESEIMFRNTTDKGVVTKVVLYDGVNSKELLDFNVYLSGYDAFRFKIADGKVTTADASVPRQISYPYDAAFYDDGNLSTVSYVEDRKGLVMNTEGETLQLNVDNSGSEIGLRHTDKAEGYVIVYGMMQSDSNATSDTNHREWKTHSYHGVTGHEDLVMDYRKVLDNCRENWRLPYDTTAGDFTSGVMVATDYNVSAPDVNTSCDDNVTNYSRHTGFTSVEAEALIGTVKISNPNGQARELMIPATAVSNFTQDTEGANLGQMMLWTEGEYAHLADRDINATNATVHSSYDQDGVVRDTNTFLISNAYYTYENSAEANNSDNALLLTQPHKRILVQLANFANVNEAKYWHNFASSTSKFGGFKINIRGTFDEDEGMQPAAERESTMIVSPFNSSSMSSSTFDNELQIIKPSQLENRPGFEFNNNKDGFIIVDMLDTDGLPAIVTQMVGTKVNGVAQANWIYAPVTMHPNAN